MLVEEGLVLVTGDPDRDAENLRRRAQHAAARSEDELDRGLVSALLLAMYQARRGRPPGGRPRQRPLTGEGYRDFGCDRGFG